MKEFLGTVIEENPFTFILALIGAVIGFLSPSPLLDFINSNWLNVTNPQQTIENVFIGLPIAWMLEAIFTLIGGFIGMIIGLIIDGTRNIGGRNY